MNRTKPFLKGVIFTICMMLLMSYSDHSHYEYVSSNHSHYDYASNYHTHNDYHSHYEYADNYHTHNDVPSHDHDGIFNSSFLKSYAREDHTHSEYDDYYLKQRIANLESEISNLQFQINLMKE